VNGAAKCWGQGTLGRLGNGASTLSLVPVDVTGLSSGVVALSAGTAHTCALTAAGGVKCWGAGSSGQLGNGATANQTTPVDVFGLSSGVAAISAGSNHTCALTTAGGVKCWGDNFFGQLGTGNTTQSNIPIDVLGLTSGVASVEAGLQHTCAASASGGAHCWGNGGPSPLGRGWTWSSFATEVLSPNSDNDGCSDAEENGANPAHGGDRDPQDPWDFFDVTGDRTIDLADALAILSRFGLPAVGNELFDRHVPNISESHRTAYAGNGIDLADVIANLQSFGHSCAGPT
jgi:hypothetical protein